MFYVITNILKFRSTHVLYTSVSVTLSNVIILIYVSVFFSPESQFSVCVFRAPLGDFALSAIVNWAYILGFVRD